MTRDTSGRHWSIYFLFLFAIVALLMVFGSIWLADTAQELAEKKKQEKEQDTEDAEDPAPDLEGAGDTLEPDEGSVPGPSGDGSDDEKPTTTQAPTSFPPIEVWTPNDPGPYRKVVEALRSYLDLANDVWSTRSGAVQAVAQLTDSDKAPLTNLPLLRWLVAQGRSFAPLPTNRVEAKKRKVAVISRGEWGDEISSTHQRMHIRQADAAQTASRDAFPRPGPWPLLFALHAPGDEAGRQGAGQAWLERHWPRDAHPDLYRDWHVLMPIVPGGIFNKNGMILPSVHGALRSFWQSYHIDFDRVVLDGRDDALLHAVTNGRAFLAGLVLRDLLLAGGQIESDKLRNSLRNLGDLPVYVVDRPDVAKALQKAGHRHVTSGPEGARLLGWMRGCHRKQPRAFRWRMVDRDQTLAYWINIDKAIEGFREQELSVEIRKNTIDIECEGIAELTVFLDDELVDLDQVVQLRINRVVVVEDLIPMRATVRETTRRDLREYFERKPIDVRRYRYFGWLKAAQLTRIRVR